MINHNFQYDVINEITRNFCALGRDVNDNLVITTNRLHATFIEDKVLFLIDVTNNDELKEYLRGIPTFSFIKEDDTKIEVMCEEGDIADLEEFVNRCVYSRRTGVAV